MFLIKRIIFLLAIVISINYFAFKANPCKTDTECEAEEALKCWVFCQR